MQKCTGKTFLISSNNFTMKKITATLAILFFILPSVSSAAALTQQQSTSLIAVVQSSPGTPASAFVSLITAFSNITVNQATSLITVVQAAPGVPANAFVNLLTSFTVDTPAIQSTNIVPNDTPAPQSPPSNPTQTAPSISNSPIPTEISIQSSVCNLASSNFKNEYDLANLLSSGNIDGRIWMNAYILDQNGHNYFTNNPSPTLIVTTSNHSNDRTANGSGATGPCGYYYGYEFYATQVGTYTITYSIPSLNLSKTITIKVKGPDKPVISSSGVTVSTPEKETDYSLNQRDSFSGIVKYWFQSSKPDSYITAKCSDADTSFTKVEVVSHMGTDGLYYPRGWFYSGQQFSGDTTCKFIHGSDNSMTITSESDPVVMSIQ